MKDFDIKDNDLESINIKHNDLKLISLICLISTFIIDIIHNINMDLYIRDIVIPFSIMIGSYIIIINKIKLKKNNRAYIYLIPIILILVSEIVTNIDESNKMLNILILPTLISMFLFLLVNRNYIISKESVVWVFKLFPRGIFSNLKCIKRLFNSIKNDKTKSVLNILFGCLIGLPIAGVLLFLLSNADKYFNKFIGSILNFFSSIFDISFLTSDLLIIPIIFIILFSIFINLLKNKDEKIKEVTYNKINNTITSTILILINTVFVLFLVSEISKITTNFLQLPIEYTYAEYAREGFFQLLVVTSINFMIIMYYVYYTKVIKDNKFIKKMLLLLLSFSIILIFNSYYRMFLYIGAYNFTILRLQVIMFLAMELILFLILIKKIISKLKYNDAILFTTILLLFYILNIYICTDVFVRLLNWL